MSPSLLAMLAVILMFVFIFLGMPISFVLFVVGSIGLFLLVDPGAVFTLISVDVFGELTSYTLGVIPLYILMGEIVFRAGISKNLFNAAYKWVGSIRGGMAVTTILGSAGFSAVSGSNTATAATMGTMALPELRKYKYNDALSTGSVAAGGTLGVIIPPSTVLIIVALQTQQSIVDLFVASIIPSILLVLFMVLTVYIICKVNTDFGPAGEKYSFREKIKSLGNLLPVITLFAFIVGGLYYGLFTPTESGAAGAAGALLLSVVMRKMTWKKFKLAVESTLRSSSMIVLLVLSAVVYGRFLALTQLPQRVSDYIDSLSFSPVIVITLILLIFLIAGSLMDSLGFLIIGIPIFFPAVIALGYDPVWFGVVFTIVTSVGAITPPVGVNVFVVKGLSPATSVLTIFKGAGYFLIAYAAFFGIAILFPDLLLVLVR